MDPSYEEIRRHMEQVVAGAEDLNAFSDMIRSLSWEQMDSDPDPGRWTPVHELAYDLEYLVPDEEVRREDPSYFGPDRALRHIANTLARMRAAT